MKDEPGNRLAFLKKNNLDKKIIISANLVHGKRVVVTDSFKYSQTMISCDALITNHPEQVLTLTAADCLPVYFYDPKKQVIALAHAGWRGLVASILPAVINCFKMKYQSQPEDVMVVIGPHLQACHFSVQVDIANLFSVSDQITKPRSNIC
jgi:polyphenol oxidase